MDSFQRAILHQISFDPYNKTGNRQSRYFSLTLRVGNVMNFLLSFSWRKGYVSIRRQKNLDNRKGYEKTQVGWKWGHYGDQRGKKKEEEVKRPPMILSKARHSTAHWVPSLLICSRTSLQQFPLPFYSIYNLSSTESFHVTVWTYL